MAGSANLPLAGVEAIVEGLSQFQGDIRSMNSSINSLKPGTTMLQEAFNWAWESVKNFGREVLNVAEYALGKILADAVEWAVTKIQELIGAIIDAGSQFQALEIRLNRLNLNDITKNQLDYVNAADAAAAATKRQLDWLQKLAVTTPYDAQDIANVYTLARSYGFADDRAQSLTQSIVNFASGMGLGNTEIQRIIVNFGQLVQQNKMNSRELMDLARGAFVPVNDVLEITQKKLGLTNKEWAKMQKAGELTGDAVQAFISSFEELVGQRFAGAAEDMARTWKGATDNVVDFFKSLLGMGVVKPVLSVLGGRIADLITSLTKGANWDKMVEGANRVGKALSNLLSSLLGLMPSTDNLAGMIIAGLNKLADWIEQHKQDVINFFVGIGDTIRNQVIPWIQDHLVPIFDRIISWVQENGPTIQKFFSTVGQIVKDFFKDLTSRPGKPEGEGDILDSITQFMQYVIDHQDQILKWIEVLWSLFVVWQVISTMWVIIISALISLGTTIVGLISIFTALVSFLAIPLVGTIATVIAMLGGLYLAFQTNLGGFRDWVTKVTGWFEQLGRDTAYSLTAMYNAIAGMSWQRLGQMIIQGIINGVLGSAGGLVLTMVRAALSAYNAAKAALGIKSPSQLFMEIGEFTMEGFAQGIEKAAGLAVGAMQNAVGQVVMPAMASVNAARGAGDTITNNRTANLTVNTGAPAEPILQDFNMLESLMGA